MYGFSQIVSSGEFEPSEFYLSQNYPNPFKERTVIKYCLAYNTRVQLTIYNSAGKEIEKLVDEEQKAGTYEVEFQVTEIQKAESGEQKAVRSQQLTINQKAVSTNLTSSRGRDENHPGFSKAESGEQKAGEDRLLGDEEYVYRLEAGDYSCEKKMIHRS